MHPASRGFFILPLLFPSLFMAVLTTAVSFTGALGEAGGGLIIPGNLGGSVPPTAGNPCSISDQNV